MNCLCCGKPLTVHEELGWHSSCIKKFFGTSTLPKINFDKKTIDNLAKENARKHLTVPGVQKKLSLHLLSKKGAPRLTIVDYPTGYILKPQVEEYVAVPESEQLIMCMADISGIKTVPHALIKDGKKYSYITKRIDREIKTNSKSASPETTIVKKLAMEDFCQLDYRLTEDKYKGSYERCIKIIEKHSSRVLLDLTELFMRLVFSYVVGNSDMHLKNFSLIEDDYKSGAYVLSPAYDLLPVSVIMPSDTEQLALTLNGKKHNIRRKDFLVFADKCNINRNSAEKMIEKIVSKASTYKEMCAVSYIPEKMQENLINLIDFRLNFLN